MKKRFALLRFFLPVLLLICTGATSYAQHYVPVDEGSKVQFTIVNHLIFTSTVNGYFKGLKGDIRFDPNELKSAVIEATVAVKTISTGIRKRDRDLLGEKYFNADKFPEMRLHSTSVTAGGKANTYHLAGALTIKGVTKNISIPFTAVVKGNSCEFKASFTINRKDFKVGPDNAIEDKLTVTLDVMAKKQ